MSGAVSPAAQTASRAVCAKLRCRRFRPSYRDGFDLVFPQPGTTRRALVPLVAEPLVRTAIKAVRLDAVRLAEAHRHLFAALWTRHVHANNSCCRSFGAAIPRRRCTRSANG